MENLISYIALFVIITGLIFVFLLIAGIFDMGPFSHENTQIREEIKEIKKRYNLEKELRKLGLYHIKNDYYSIGRRVDNIEATLIELKSTKTKGKKRVNKK